MSHYSGEQSEDGELAQSPADADGMDFSLSSSDGEAGDVDGETGDSLDIKPPQAPARGAARDRRDRRRRERDRDRRDRDRDPRDHRDPRNRTRREDKHYRDAAKPPKETDVDMYYAAKDHHKQRDPHKERDPHRNRPHFRDKDFKEKDAYREPHAENHRERAHRREDKERERMPKHADPKRKRPDEKRRPAQEEPRQRYADEEIPPPRRIEKENRDKSSGDQELEDLRSRLLSKRQTKERQEAPDSLQERKQDKRDKQREARRRMQMDASPEQDISRVPLRLPELDKTQLERREKLLQTEREMSQRKKAAAARREMKENISKRPHISPPPSHRKRRRHSQAPSPQTPSDVVTVSDASDSEMKDGSDRSDNSGEDNDSGSSSDSSSGSTDEESATEEEEEREEEDEDKERAISHPKHPKKKKYEEKGDLSEQELEQASPLHMDTSPASVHSDTPKHGSYREDLSRSPSRSRSHSFSPPPVEENGSSSAIVTQPEEPPKSSPTPPPPDERDLLPPYFPAIQGCRSVEEFQCLNRIEEGTYGVVYRARDKTTDEIVALKRLKMEKEKEGFPITSLREINTLLKGQHPNIVTVREIVVGSNMDKIFIVMDYVEHDLKGLMETMRARKQMFIPGEVKCLMQQLLKAVDHLHDNWILHRDLKASNLLLSHKGILKVGDFGLAREYGSPLKSYTPVVVTLWYRAPELLLGTKQYSTPIDIWSVGCIFAEFITMHPLFPGKSEVDQLNKIFKEMGTPNETVWPGWSSLAGARATWADQPGGGLRSRVGSHLSEAGLQLLNGLLTYNPEKRFTANDALCHHYFKEQPMAIDPAMFPTWPAKSEGGRRHQHSPKPPSGGDQYKLLRDEDQATVGFHMGQPGPASAPFLPPISTGFKLKF